MLKTRARNFVTFLRQTSKRSSTQDKPYREHSSRAPGIDQTDKRTKARPNEGNLDMERFLTKSDEVFNNSKYRKYLFSSSDEDSADEHHNFKSADQNTKLSILDNGTSKVSIGDSDECGEDQVYAIDAHTGEWQAHRQQPIFPSEHFNERTMQKDSNYQRWKNVGKKLLKPLHNSNQIEGRYKRSRDSVKYDSRDDATVRLLEDDDSEDSSENARLT